MELIWTYTKDYLTASTKNFKFTERLAMFDLDSTLIKPKIGNKKGFPLDENDWIWNYPNTKEVLRNLDKLGYSIVIISNQGGMSTGKQTSDVWSKKLNQICISLNLNLHVFCSTDHNKYRKPFPTWFYDFVPETIQNKLDRSMSFYCGDAAGRPDDFSNTDFKFAMNCMIKFKTPEDLFLGRNISLPVIKYPELPTSNPNFTFVPKHKEIIVMVGLQGSGKSFLSKILNIKYGNFAEISPNGCLKNTHYGYEIINQDTLKTKAKCIKLLNQHLNNNKCVIIDLTNPDVESRSEWIQLAKNKNYTARAICMTTTKELAMHNNYFRHMTQGVKVVPKIAYNIYCSKFVKPTKSEGFDEIIKASSGKPNDNRYYLYLY